MEKRNLICIGCPMGCPLVVTMDHGEVVSVEGNTCKRGTVYGKKEVTNPTRIVTSTVRVSGGSIPVVSVKTREDIPKEKIFDCIKALHNKAHWYPSVSLQLSGKGVTLPVCLLRAV